MNACMYIEVLELDVSHTLRNDRKPLRVRLTDATNDRAAYLLSAVPSGGGGGDGGGSDGDEPQQQHEQQVVSYAYEKKLTLLEEGAAVIQQLCGVNMTVRAGRVEPAESGAADGGGDSAAAGSDGLDSEMVQEQEQEQEKEQEAEVKAKETERGFDHSPRFFTWNLSEIFTDDAFEVREVFCRYVQNSPLKQTTNNSESRRGTTRSSRRPFSAR